MAEPLRQYVHCPACNALNEIRKPKLEGGRKTGEWTELDRTHCYRCGAALDRDPQPARPASREIVKPGFEVRRRSGRQRNDGRNWDILEDGDRIETKLTPDEVEQFFHDRGVDVPDF